MLINFDFDGVIADTFDRLLVLCAAAQAAVAEGREPLERDLRTLENLTFEGLADRIGISPETIPDFLQTVFELQQKEQGTVRFFHGMTALLRSLSENNDIAIITSNSGDLVRGYLVEHGIADRISSLCGGDSGRSKRESLLANMEQFSVSPQQTCMIGDAVSDIRQGKAAGVVCIAVSWGFHSRGFLLPENPDYLVNDPEELLAVLRGMGC